jgi:hypothetical protein
VDIDRLARLHEHSQRKVHEAAKKSKSRVYRPLLDRAALAQYVKMTAEDKARVKAEHTPEEWRDFEDSMERLKKAGGG